MAVFALTALSALAQRQICDTRYVKKENPMKAVLCEINNTNNQNATRFIVDLVSVPNTSSRIDSATWIADGRRCLANDIDGVDFQRYFQWEEDGVVRVEIDFPRLKRLPRNSRIVLHTVHGDCVVDMSQVSNDAKAK